MKKVISIFCTFLFLQSVISQYPVNMAPPAMNGQHKDFLPASPGAASLGIFGQIPVGNYTGVAQISVPLYTMSYKELEVPIGLSYHTTANKPDNFPGPVGLGWGLNAGGAITRVIKGLPDNDLTGSTPVDIPFLFNPTGPSQWSNDSSMYNYLRFGYSAANDKSNPDEYYFNFCGFAGKFYLNRDDEFKIQSTEGHYLTVKAEILTNKMIKMPHLPKMPVLGVGAVQPQDSIWKSRIIYSFVVTDGKGIKYKFGSNDSAIEFSRPGHNYASYSGTFDMDNLVIPTSWNLVSIESPNKYKINFTYSRGFTVTKIGYSDMQAFVWQNSNGQSPLPSSSKQLIGVEKSTLMNVCYLSKIVSPIDSISFVSSNAGNQLQYPRDGYIDSLPYYENNHINYSPTNENLFVWYRDITFAYTQDLLPKKFDSIVVSSKDGALFKRICFDYTNNTETRLKLLAVRLLGHSNDESSQKYQFEYNSLALPGYLSYKTDHYGYYNGKTPYMPRSLDIDTNALFAAKAPDTNYVRAEILEKIIYPTGGYTSFQYEPNKYSKWVKTWPFTVDSGTTDKITGGLRIKKVISYSAPGRIASVKEYKYVKNYAAGGQLSSGILAYQPVYTEYYNNMPVTAPLRYSTSPPGTFNGNLTLKHWSTNAIFPMSSTMGNHIVYPEATEVNADSSFVTSKYKSYDNGYNDKAPLNKISDNTNIKQFWTEEEGISMDIERGQLLSEELYSATAVKVKKRLLFYNDDSLRFENNVRVLVQSTNNLAFYSYRVLAKLIYTYFPYLKKTVTEEYYGQDTVSLVEMYTYDSLLRVVRSKITATSAGDTQKVVNSFPKDLVKKGEVTPYQQMLDKGMLEFPIEIEQYRDSLLMSKSITRFSKGISQDTSLILPSSMEVQYKKKAPEVRAHLHLYDKYGNLLMESKEKGLKICYVWSYNHSKVIAKISGAEYSIIDSLLGGKEAVDSFANIIPGDMVARAYISILRTSSLLANAFIVSYTYHPLAGVSSETDPNGKTVYYEYDWMGRLAVVRDNDKNILKKICYDYSGQPTACQEQREIYAKLSYVNKFAENGVKGDVIVRFYYDRKCEIPATVKDLIVKYQIVNTCNPVQTIYDTVSGSVDTLALKVPLKILLTYPNECNISYQLTNNNNQYVIVDNPTNDNPTVFYASLFTENMVTTGTTTTADIYVRFFYDKKRTIPAVVNNVEVSFMVQSSCGFSFIQPVYATGSSVLVSAAFPIETFEKPVPCNFGCWERLCTRIPWISSVDGNSYLANPF